MSRALGLILAMLVVAALALWVGLREVPRGHDPATEATAPPPEDDPPAPPPAQPSRAMLEVAPAPLPSPRPRPTSAALRGRVLDGLGEPLAGCDIRFEAAAAAEAGTSTQTGPDGRFEVFPTPDQLGWLAVAHRDFPRQVALANLRLQAGEERDLGDFALASRPGLIVSVRGRGGEAIVGASVDALPALRDVSLPTRAQLMAARAARSDATGRAVLYGVPAGAYVLRVEADRYASLEQAHVQDANLARAPEVTVLLDLGSTINGRVTAPEGGDLGKTVVRAEPLAPGVALETIALPSGEFRLVGAASGRYRLTAESTRYPSATTEVTTPTDQPVALVLTRGEVLTGIVRTRAGQPIADARIEVEPEDGWPLQRAGESVRPSAQTDPSGTFRIVGLPAGRFTVRATSDAFVPASATLTIPTAPIELRLDAGLTVLGVVLLDGQPKASAKVTVVDSQADGSAFAEWKQKLLEVTPKSTVTDPQGRFTLAGIAPGRHRLHVQVEGCPPQISATLEGTEGATLDLGSLSLIPGAKIVGVAAPWATVCLDRLGSPGLSRSVVADGTGRFTFDGLAAGRYELFYHFPERAKPAAHANQRQTTLIEVTLRQGSSEHVQLPRN